MVTSLTSVLRTVCTLLLLRCTVTPLPLTCSSSCASALPAHDSYYYITVPRLYILIPSPFSTFLFLLHFFFNSILPRFIQTSTILILQYIIIGDESFERIQLPYPSAASQCLLAANSRVFGSLDSFDPKAVEWELYETQFDFFLQANGVTDAKQKRALLLSTIGMGALSYVRDLNMPVTLNDDATTYDKLIEQLRSHYGKKTAVLAGRSDFTSIRQKDAQSVEEFAAALRAAAIHCKFGAELDIRLRDQFVIGLKN